MLTSNLFTVRSGAGFVLAASAIVLLGTLPSFRHMSRRKLFMAAAGLLIFQVFHFLEHLIQLGYWFMHPTARPYMTPWAVEGLEGLGLWATIVPGDGEMMMRGMELLHLVGNFLFLGGILALERLGHRGLPGIQLAKKIQSIHLAEHVLLTTSVFILGSPLGMSTLFGISEGTEWGGTVRVWFHFLINLAATIPAMVALWAYHSRSRSAADDLSLAAEPRSDTKASGSTARSTAPSAR